MKLSPRTLSLGLAALLLAAGALWWLLPRAPQTPAPVAVTPPVTAPAAPLAEEAPAPAPDAAPVAPVGPLAEETPTPAPVAAAPVPPPAPAPSAAPSVAAAPLAPADEVAATERMYLAHAPLRTPELSDPDSETNRRILETMVTKALAQPAASPTAPTAPATP